MQKSKDVDYTITGAVEEMDGKMIITVKEYKCPED